MHPLHVYDQPGRYTVTLVVGGAGGSDTITKSDYITVYGMPASLTLTAAPVTLPAGSSSTLTATVTDQDGNAVADGTVVSFTTDLGSVSPITAVTVNGIATATLSAIVLGTATVTATVGSLSSTVQVTFIAGPPAQLSLTATPAVIAANGISQSTVLATVRDAFGNPVPDAQVNFLAGIGRFSPASGTTDANGQVTASLTSLVPGTENVFATVETLVAQTPVTYQLPPASQLGLNGSSVVATRTLSAVRKNGLITYTLTITNNGDGTVTNILMVAPIPDGTVYVDGSASGGNYAGLNANNLFGPQVTQNAVAWSGSLAPGAAHTLSYVVQVVILEGQIVNQPRVFVNNEDAGINLGSTVQVEARKAHIPIVRRQ